jgi:aspartyl-tRNA(Asn)/glutamyl-tRNA(Gln) amidotransferase subunit B
LKAIHSLVRYLEICDGNMQEGSFRCDANVSVRPKGETTLGTRAELKNINSFRYVEKAINYEVERQIALIESGGKVLQETRLFDSVKNETRSMRSKEEANDYRYFPDPDLLPVLVTEELIKETQAALPELPHQKRQRFMGQYALSAYDAGMLVSSRALAQYFETVVSESKAQPKLVANWVMGDLSAALNKDNIEISESPVSSSQFAQLLQRMADETISGKIAKTVFEAMWNGEGSADEIIEKQGLKQVTDSGAIEQLVDKIIAANPGQVADYRCGKDKLFGFFVGQAMKESGGKINPQQLNDLLKKKLLA